MKVGCRLTVTTLSEDGWVAQQTHDYPGTAVEAVRARVARLRFARRPYQRKGCTLVLPPTASDQEGGIVETTLHFKDVTP